ncbi:uncharacterized protein TNCV_887271 [Trichonephila clavipes]|uniref:Uncharacterized protein n=1 Tax=Trichonephila clavipes TaxID=2585209 RepID=A0A8X6V1S8_TRICX|nr:uncharacterized protein TNCV_887271 [Trichonephila clavipes]
MNDAITEIKMTPHKPRKSTPEQDSEDEDMIEYNPDEFDADEYVQKSVCFQVRGVYDHREEITDFVKSIPGFREWDEEDVEIWMACDAEDYGFQMLYDDKIMTSVQEESIPSSMGPSNAEAFSVLETAMEWYE